MGVRSLLRYIHLHHKDCLENIPLKSLSGYRFAVDGNNFMHYIAAKVEERLMMQTDADADRTSVLSTMTNVLVHNLSPLLNHKVEIVVVMDGSIPEMKLSHSIAKNRNLLPVHAVAFGKDSVAPLSAAFKEGEEEEDPFLDEAGASALTVTPSIDVYPSDCLHSSKRWTSRGRRNSKELPREKRDNDKSKVDSRVDIRCTCTSKQDTFKIPNKIWWNKDPTCPLHRPLPRGTYMISYGKRNSKPDTTYISQMGQNKRNICKRNRSKSTQADDCQLNGDKLDPRGSKGYRNYCKRGMSMFGARYHSSYVLDHSSLFKEDFNMGVYSLQDNCTRSALQSGHSRYANGSFAMNAMDRKSYFVDLMLMMGIPVIRASGEAEMTCCSLLKSNLVNGIISRDTDHLVIGCTDLIITLKSDTVEKLNMSKLLNKLDLTHREFVDFCILCGTDYNMPNTGYTRCLMIPEKALTVIKHYGCIENASHHTKLPSTQYLECRLTYEMPTKLRSQVEDSYSRDTLSPKSYVWKENRRILPGLGMKPNAVNILDRYYSMP